VAWLLAVERVHRPAPVPADDFVAPSAFSRIPGAASVESI